MRKLSVWMYLVSAFVFSCDSSKNSDESRNSKSYSFSTSASTKVSGSNLGLSNLELIDSKVESNLEVTCANSPNFICIAPSALTGKYFSVGLLIQANGQGMQSYFHKDTWSEITASSTTYDFNAATPFTHTGNLTCCGGTGDLSGENVYFSDVNYVFAYLDATFKIPYTTQQQSTVSTAMKANHTVRFVFIDDILSSYKRGDLLYKDTDGVFKWSDQSGNLTSTRPSAPITMNSKIVNYENPFGGNVKVVVIGSLLNPASDGGVNQTSEDKLKESGKTYSFTFDSSHFVLLTLGQDQFSLIQSVKDMLQKLHLQGLPHTDLTLGTSGYTDLRIQ